MSNKKTSNWRVVKVFEFVHKDSSKLIITFNIHVFIVYVYPQCPKQSEVVECGYYVMRFMHDIIMSRSTSVYRRHKYTGFKTIIMSFILNQTNLQ